MSENDFASMRRADEGTLEAQQLREEVRVKLAQAGLSVGRSALHLRALALANSTHEMRGRRNEQTGENDCGND
jgi:hypothetical protein